VLFALARFGHFLSCNGLEELVCHLCLPHQDTIQVPPAIGGDCADGQLWLEWCPELAGYDDVQLGVQTMGDFSSDRHTSARDTEDEYVLIAVYP
jgi:hypothetical protein